MRENESLFIWMLRQLEMIYLEISHLYYPVTLISDADTAFIAALSTVFSRTHHLCIWHVQKDVAAYIKREFNAQAAGLSLRQHADLSSSAAQMEIDWTKMLRTSTEEEYEICWTAFRTFYSE
jgi:hypothetical protein